MATTSLTLKLPFLKLNQCKAVEFERLTALNTDVANSLLEMPKEERNKYTSKDFRHIEIGSMWINQTIRNSNAATKVKHFRRLPLEVNNQGWKIIKTGETYSLSFSLYRGRKKRIPLEIHQASHQEILDKVITREAKQGSLKLWKSKKGIWYCLLSVSMDVPDANQVNGHLTGLRKPQTPCPHQWIGADRGQNHLCVASLPDGMAKFWTFGNIRQIRRKYQKQRKSLQKAKKFKTLKRLESKERRTITHINHIISKQLVQLAVDYDCGIRLEDLSNIRKTSKQRKKNKSDAGQNRDFWCYHQLENFVFYKAQLAGIPVEKVPAAFTSKSCSKCGSINNRNKHSYRCKRCHARHHADWGASQNIGKWLGLSCSLVLEKGAPVMDASVQESGAYEAPLNQVRV